MNERATLAAAAGFWLLAAGHAVLTWPPAATAIVFLGGGLAAVLLAAGPTRLGLRAYAVDLRVAGVPAWVPLVQPASVYAGYRAAAVALGDGVGACALGAGIVTFAALRTEPDGLSAGLWSYPPSAYSAIRYRGVPWWTFAARFALAAGLPLAAQPFL